MARWTDARIGAELADFLDELRATAWPTYPQFRATGRRPLLAAIERRGGIASWADTVGLSLRPRAGRRRWSEQRINAELRSYLTRRPTAAWPTRAEFTAQDERALLAAIDHGEGLEHWKRRLADPLLERRLRIALADHDRWPTTAEWIEGGEWALLATLHRHQLGTQGWADRLGLPHPGARRRRGDLRTPPPDGLTQKKVARIEGSPA